uniref:Uncharacterized protein n=2 Tax=Meloidogyne TaxID=189290 RepID=A0A6V7Y1V6_MELEN|nr:unnamed protein product [Meloidogyne enterolobii]CAD2192153.1 unnamed protein product [Meloidogyne enterolobii]CAD2202517.1 unnamed protein product [Meloidogyne enterolobii]CAD2205496.1 unnamed protein product [Meloidogyne enterolobii]
MKTNFFTKQKMFKAPFTMVISGATGSGKTQWLMKFLANCEKLIDPPPNKILFCFGEMNENIFKLKEMGITTYNGVPEVEMIKKHQLLVLDDLMLNIPVEFLDLLFTRGSHNWGVSVIFVTQSLYGRDIRTARANAHYILLTKNPQGLLQVRTLGSQLFPKMLNYFLEAYRDATSEQFSYLLINMHPSTEENLRLSTKIFPGEKQTIYLPL